jgi:hypothetical protein
VKLVSNSLFNPDREPFIAKFRFKSGILAGFMASRRFVAEYGQVDPLD